MWIEVRQMAQRALNRLNNVLSRGKLNTLTTGKTNTANVSILNDETYDGIEFANDWGFMSYPPCDGNTELVMGFLRGQRDNGTVLRSFNRKFNPVASGITLIEGECILYNKVTNCYIHMKQDGSIHIKSATLISIDAPSVTMTGNLSVAGDILDSTNLSNTDTARGTRTIFNEHTHSGVAPGAANTGIPNQLE